MSEFKLSEMHEHFLSEFFNTLEEGHTNEKDFQKLFKSAFTEASKVGEEILSKALKAAMPAMITDHIEMENGFIDRNKKRWREGLDHMRALIVLCDESGQAAISGILEFDEHKYSAKLNVLISLHARSLKVSREIMWLIEGGFADGALGRWRTLHELATISSFIFKNNEATATRYLASRNCEAFKAAKQYIKHEKRAGLLPFDKFELEKLKILSEATIAEFGKEIENQHGWAYGALAKCNPNFFDLEVFCEMDHWRPRYKWACQETHASFVPNKAGLGVSESNESIHLVGQSNSGMIDPAQMTAISLSLSTTNLLLLEPNLDRIVAVKCIQSFSDLVSNSFFIGGKKTD